MKTQSTPQKIAPSPPAMPLLGHIPKMAKDPLGFVWDSAMNYGDVVRLSFIAISKTFEDSVVACVEGGVEIIKNKHLHNSKKIANCI